MTDSNGNGSNPEQRLNNALADYMQRLDRGEPIDREAFLAQHADIADQLRAYFDDADLVERMAGPRADDTLPSPGVSAVSVPPLTRIRYFGDYELLEEIARGGMGVVYKARQVSLNRIVALKMILAGQLASEADVRRFYAEAEAAANLDHPRIVPIFEIGQHEGQHYFSMAFVEGTSLAARLAEGPLPPREAAALLKQVAEAVQYAHQQGVIHRDLKPANVLIDKHGHARVTDFGLAKRVQSASDLTGTGQILGTPSYMPPEQAAGKTDEIRETADVYSLGAILYAMLTGHPPFQADNTLDTLLQVMEREPVAPRQVNPKAPIDLETICLKCLEKMPRRRYASAAELGAELGRFLEGRPISARRINRAERARRWCKRNPAIASLISSLVLLLLVSAIGAAAAAVRQASLRRQAEVQVYLSDIKLAKQAWEDADVERAMEILKSHKRTLEQEDLRGWEWYYLYSLCMSSSDRFNEGTCLAISPVDQRLAIGQSHFNLERQSWRHSVVIWDLDAGRRVASLEGHTEPIASLAWSQDGKRLASGSQDKTVKLWDVATSQLVASLSSHRDGVQAVVWSPDGKRVASGCRDGTVRVWHLEEEREIAKFEDASFTYSLAWSPDGRLLVSAEVSGLRVWDTSTWEETWFGGAGDKSKWSVVKSRQGDVLKESRRHADSRHVLPHSVSWSPDGKRLAAGGLGLEWEPCIVVWNRDSNEKQTFYGHRREVVAVAWSPDGTKLASGSRDKTIRIWDVANGRQVGILRTQSADQLAWSADGERIVSQGNSLVQVWDATRPQEALAFAESEDEQFISWNPESSRVVVGDSRSDATVWDARGRRLWSLFGAKSPVAWSPDGLYIAATAAEHDEQGVQQIAVWSARGQKLHRMLRGHTGSIHNLAWSHDGSMLASISVGFAVNIDGKKVLDVDSDRVVRIWDIDTGRQLRSIETGASDYVDCVAWNPVASEICWARGQVIGIIDADSGASIGHFDATEGIRSIGWCPDGNQILVGYWSNHKIAVFGRAGNKVREFQGHSAAVNSVAWCRDQRRIASASADGTVRVWDAATAQEVLMFVPQTFKRLEANSVSWSPDGHRLAAWQDGAVKTWDASTAYRLESANQR